MTLLALVAPLGATVAIAVAVAATLTGCAGPTRSAPAAAAAPAADRAYLYGRFQMNPVPATFAVKTFGFRLACADGSSHDFRMVVEDPVYGIAIAPGECSYVETVYFGAEGTRKGARPAPASALKAAKFEAGKAYYLGDYTGRFDLSPQGGAASFNWTLDAAVERQQQTTAQLQSRVPQLRSMTIERRMLIGLEVR